jgi:cytochrome d ubiquinol oxidase subunit I
VYGLLRTADGASPLPAERIAESLLLFVVVYSLLIALYLFYLKRVVQNGLAAVAAQPLMPVLPRSTAVSLDEPTGQKE